MKQQCPKCKEYPAWNKTFSDKLFRVNPVYECGVCSFQRVRKVYLKKGK